MVDNDGWQEVPTKKQTSMAKLQRTHSTRGGNISRTNTNNGHYISRTNTARSNARGDDNYGRISRTNTSNSVVRVTVDKDVEKSLKESTKLTERLPGNNFKPLEPMKAIDALQVQPGRWKTRTPSEHKTKLQYTSSGKKKFSRASSFATKPAPSKRSWRRSDDDDEDEGNKTVVAGVPTGIEDGLSVAATSEINNFEDGTSVGEGLHDEDEDEDDHDLDGMESDYSDDLESDYSDDDNIRDEMIHLEPEPIPQLRSVLRTNTTNSILNNSSSLTRTNTLPGQKSVYFMDGEANETHESDNEAVVQEFVTVSQQKVDVSAVADVIDVVENKSEVSDEPVVESEVGVEEDILDSWEDEEQESPVLVDVKDEGEDKPNSENKSERESIVYTVEDTLTEDVPTNRKNKKNRQKQKNTKPSKTEKKIQPVTQSVINQNNVRIIVLATIILIIGRIAWSFIN